MAVIINELEVIVEPPQQTAARGGGAETPAAQAGGATVQPHDYQDILDRMRRYDLRVAAH
jgi:hypothetical protein